MFEGYTINQQRHFWEWVVYFFLISSSMLGRSIADEPVFKPTGRYADLTVGKQGDKPVLYITTMARGCEPCNRLHRDIEAGKLDGFTIEHCEPFQGMRSYPAIRFRNENMKSGWAVIYGWSPENLTFLQSIAPAAEKAEQGKSIYTGEVGSSHENRASLIDHLFNDGIHKGRHTLASLNAMTDEQLDALHTQDHGTIERRPVIQQRGGRWFNRRR